MPRTHLVKPRVFIDADVLFAATASASEHGANIVILRMSGITLIETITSQQVIVEVERNLSEKFPGAIPKFQQLVRHCLRVVPDPSFEDIQPYVGLADQKDLPILVSAIRESCLWLVTFNVKDFQPGYSSVMVVNPGTFLLRVRNLLTNLTLDKQ